MSCHDVFESPENSQATVGASEIPSYRRLNSPRHITVIELRHHRRISQQLRSFFSTYSQISSKQTYTNMNIIHSTLDTLRDRWAPISHTSTFRTTGQVTPEEFVLAGDYLVYKFPTWSWSDASTPSKRVTYLPPTKQFLITRGVPCHRRLDENFAGDAGQDEAMVQDGFTAGGEGGGGGSAGGEDDGWLRTGGLAASQEARMRDVRTVDESGNVGEREEEEEIPDMEDEDDDEEAIIRDPKGSGTTA